MAKKILQLIDGAYRCTLEEQDDPAIWITNAMKGAGGDFTVVLSGNAVNYGVKAQDASGLAFGAWRQTMPPRIHDDLAKLMEKGVAVHVVEEDVAERGLERGELIAGLKPIARGAVPKLLATHDLVWRW